MALALIFSACDQPTSPASPGVDTVDKTALTQAISAAETLLGSVTVGNDIGNTPQAAYDAYSTAINEAKAVAGYSDPTQLEIDNAVAALAAATSTFSASVLTAYPAGTNGVLFASDGLTTASTIQEWDSGSTLTTITDDSDYGIVMKVEPGWGWGASSSCIAFVDIGDYLAAYNSMTFKIKSDDLDAIIAKVPDVEITYGFSDHTDLGNGWYEISVSFGSYSGTQAAPTAIGILGGWSKGGTFFITDVQLSTAVIVPGTAYYQLNKGIASATTLLNDTAVGTANGNVSQADHDTFAAAIAAAQSVADNSSATQSEVDTAVSDLAAAKSTFESAILILEDVVLFAADGSFAEAYDTWGSGSAVTAISDDADYVNVLEVIPGSGWGASSSCIAYTGQGDFQNNYSSVTFKIKSADLSAIIVAIPWTNGTANNQEISYPFSGATDLGNEWFEVVVPFSDYAIGSAGATEFGITGGYGNGGTFYITDIVLNL